MRQKKTVLVISFKRIEGALDLEKALKGRPEMGRIIPLPTEISAGCGFAWRAPLEAEQELADFMQGRNIAYEGLHYLEMY